MMLRFGARIAPPAVEQSGQTWAGTRREFNSAHTCNCAV